MKYRLKAWGFKDKDSGVLSGYSDYPEWPLFKRTRSVARKIRHQSEKVVRLDVTMEVKECGE